MVSTNNRVVVEVICELLDIVRSGIRRTVGIGKQELNKCITITWSATDRLTINFCPIKPGITDGRMYITYGRQTLLHPSSLSPKFNACLFSESSCSSRVYHQRYSHPPNLFCFVREDQMSCNISLSQEGPYLDEYE